MRRTCRAVVFFLGNHTSETYLSFPSFTKKLFCFKEKPSYFFAVQIIGTEWSVKHFNHLSEENVVLQLSNDKYSARPYE